MNYYFRSINPLDREWSLFNQKKGSVTIYYGHSQMLPDDIVLLYIGKQNEELSSGVYALGKVVSDVWRDEDDRYCVKIKLLTRAVRNQPIIPESEAALYKGNVKSVRNTFKVTEHVGRLSNRIDELLKEKDYSEPIMKKERNTIYDPIDIEESVADSKELIMPHQSDAIKAMNNYFCLEENTEDRNGLVIMPTGSGKTYTTVTWLLKYGITKGYRVVWLVHRQELVEQTFHEFRNQSPLLKGTGIKKLRIFPISGAHLHMSMACRADVYVCSIASVANKYGYRFIERMLGTAGKRKVIVVIDEAHHSVAGNYQKVIKRITKLNPNRVLLGLTATPKRLNEAEHKQLMRMYHVDTNIINHTGQHGYVYEVTLKQLLESGFLAEPHYERVDTEIIGEIEYKCTPEDEIYYNQYGDLSERIKRQIAKSSARNKIILNQYMRNKERYGKTLIFAVNQLHAETLCDVFKKAGISCDYVVSSRPGSQDIIRDFKDNKFNVLINVQILTEGSDVPDVQTVFLTRETNSDSLLMQMIGRGLRGVKAGGTEVAYIVAFHDTWDTFNAWLDPKEFIDIDGPVTTTGENEKEDENEESIEVVPKQEDENEEIDEIENGISDEDIYRTLYMKLYGSIKANICSKEDFSAFPIGWYSLVNEEGENINLLVYDEQKACYEDIGANRELVRYKLDVESFVDIYFACSPVKPDLDELAYFLDYLDETGELPPYFSFEERDFFSPNKIAEKMNSLFEKEEEKEAWLKELFEKNRILQEIYKYFYPFKKTVFDVCKKRVEAEIVSTDEREQYEIIPDYYDLQELLSEVLHMFPKLKADGLIKLSWSEKVVREWFALCQKYDDDSNLYQIHVNKLLSSSKVSRELIKYLLFHELLHQNGYWNHDSEFRRLEWQYPNSAELDGELDSLWLFYDMDEQYKDSVRFEIPEFIVNSNEEQNQNSNVQNNSNYNKNASGVQEGYKYCRNCGNKLPTDAKFCDKCGCSTDY